MSDKSRFDLFLVHEFARDLDSEASLTGVKTRPPNAFGLLMHTHKSPKHTTSKLRGVQVGTCRNEGRDSPLSLGVMFCRKPLTQAGSSKATVSCINHPNCTVSIEIDPPSTPSTGKLNGSRAARAPMT